MRSDDVSLEAIPFGRSRTITAVGATLFSLALRLSSPELARAAHLPVPQGCYIFKECHCCSGSTCCENSCLWHSEHDHGCPTSAQCWYTCVGGLTYQCCDWHVTWDNTATFCMCRGLVEGPTC